MADETPAGETPESTVTTTTNGAEVVITTDTDDLEKWKALSKKNEADLRKAQKELERLQQASMSEQEKAVALARAEGRSEAMKEANHRLLHAEVRAAAGGLLADPDDAVHLLDLSPFETDGDIDRKGIRSALENLVKTKPYLSAAPGSGSGEGGPRGAPPALNSDELTNALAAAVGARRR